VEGGVQGEGGVSHWACTADRHQRTCAQHTSFPNGLVAHRLGCNDDQLAEGPSCCRRCREEVKANIAGKHALPFPCPRLQIPAFKCVPVSVFPILL
jgi:hypothetical protein